MKLGWFFSEKPRIRLGYTVRSPSRSAFSKAPRKLVLVDFGRKEYGYQTSWSRLVGGPTVLQEPYLNSTLGFAYLLLQIDLRNAAIRVTNRRAV